MTDSTASNDITGPCARCGSDIAPRRLSPSGNAYCADYAELGGGCDSRFYGRRFPAEAMSPRLPIRATRPSRQSSVADGCPKCGGVQFKARRSTSRRIGIGASIATLGVLGAPALAAGKNQVECVLCGTKYSRRAQGR